MLIALFSLVLVAVTIWWFGFSEDSHQAASVATDSIPTSLIEQLENSPNIEFSNEGAAPVEAPSGPAARRIVHVPSSNSPSVKAESIYDDSTKITAENLVAFSKHNLDAALAGDFEAAYQVSQSIKRCRGKPQNLQEVEQQINRTTQMYEQRRNRGDYFPKRIKSEAEYLNNSSRSRTGFCFCLCLVLGRKF